NPAREKYFASVTSTASSNCWAIGYYMEDGLIAYQSLIENWDGTAWTITASPNTSPILPNILSAGVSCLSSSDCWAVGYYYNDNNVALSLIEHWDGTAWTIVSSSNTSATLSNYLLGVSCSSASDCWAVGYANDGILAYRTLIERWNGSSWTTVTSPNTGTFDNILTGTTCTSSSDCW